MDRRYTFTRAWGAVLSAFGWVILFANVLAGVVLAQEQAARVLPKLNLYVAVGSMVLAGALVGLFTGGLLIVAGQLLRIAVDSVNLQAAMLERLDALLAQRSADSAPGGRFSGLAGE